jgi:hypothetical protein
MTELAAKILLLGLTVAGAAAWGRQEQAQNNPVADPTESGVYYKGPKSFAKLQQEMMSGGGAKHMGKMFVPGLTPQVVYTFRGAHALLQILEAKPTFYIKQPSYMENVPGHSARDVVIVRFDIKKDHRELQVTSGATAFTLKSGFSKEKLPEIKVTRISDSTFSVVPSQDLKPGEYLLTFGGTGNTGHDFGIPKQGK